LRHRNLYAAYGIAAKHLFGDAPPRRFGSVFRIGGLGVLGLNFLLPMRIGCATVVLPELSITTAVDYLSRIAAHGVDFLYLVPTLVQLVTRLGRPVEGLALDCVTGAAPISEDLHREFQERFDVRLRNIYGITEASFGVFYGAVEAPNRGGWDLGPALPEVPVRLVGGDGQIVEGPGEGLLEVSGPTLADGYFGNPAATQAVFVDGWLSTGDIASRDARGHFSIVGRRKDVIIRGGFNIHLEEVDHVLLSHPAVIAAGVVGYRGNGLDESLAALVQVTEGSAVAEAEMLAWCRARIGPAKTPSTLIVTSDPLPTNGSGKIVRAQIAEMIEMLRQDTGRRARV
jgi:long-chain acyl-CoA synthetase